MKEWTPEGRGAAEGEGPRWCPLSMSRAHYIKEVAVCKFLVDGNCTMGACIGL